MEHDIAQEMLDILPGEDYWTQNSCIRPRRVIRDGQDPFARCLMGAYGQVTRGDASWYIRTGVPGEKYILALIAVIREQYPEIRMRSRFGLITTFNDMPGRTFAEVRAVLEKTRAKMEEETE